jgi:hypothetical protein
VIWIAFDIVYLAVQQMYFNATPAGANITGGGINFV